MAAVSAAPMPARLALGARPPSASQLPMRALPFLRSRLRALTTAYAVKQDAALWTPAPVSAVSAATADGTISHVVVDLSHAADLVDSYTTPGQYLKVRVPSSAGDELKPAFMAIASPPGAGPRFEFVVKTVPGTTAERLCALRDGDVVELGAVSGNGFALDKINPPDVAQTVLLFATGTGISTIHSLIEFGFAANERADVRLYYGARSLQSMAYEDRFKNWESTGVKIIPVLSRPDDSWKGERGHVQDAFFRNKNIVNPSSVGAVLCGQNEMQEVCIVVLPRLLHNFTIKCVEPPKNMLLEISSALVADGVSRDKILTNY